MGKGYSISCSGCHYHRDVLVGQGDDAFYEFYEETLFLCHGCRQLTVITTVRPYDVLLFMLEEGFTRPWSDVTAAHDDPADRMRQCEELIAGYLDGDYDHYLCAHCGSDQLEECDGIPLTCPQCGELTLETCSEFDWS